MARGPLASGKKTRGRQKIEMKKIEKEDDKLVTFSKRRSGIYKKASELTILCGAEIAIVVFSPAGKAFTFGHPSCESVVNRFLNENPPINDNAHPLVEAQKNARINQLTQEIEHVSMQLDAELGRAKLLEQVNNVVTEEVKKWKASIDELNLEEIEERKKALEDLRVMVLCTINETLTAPVAAPPGMIPQYPTPPTVMAPNIIDNAFGAYMGKYVSPYTMDPIADEENGLGRFSPANYVSRPNYGYGNGFPTHGPF